MDKEYEIARRTILRDFLKKEDNIYYAKKLFMAMSVLNWAREQKGEKETFYKYVNYVAKYLFGEIDLYWEDGIIKIKVLKDPTKGK